MYICDLGEVFVMSCKLSSCFDYKNLALPFFVMMVLSWFVTRLVWFPYFIYHTLGEQTTYPDHLKHFNIFLRLNSLYLTSLLILHVYWFYLFYCIFVALATKGATDDL